MKKQFWLSAQKVTKQFVTQSQMVSVLHGITMQFSSGSTYAIMGVSGSGKSTLLNILAGLDIPTTGKIIIDDIDIAQFKPQEKAIFLTQRIGIVFQQPFLIRELSVIENVMIKGMIMGKSQAECREIGLELLQHVGLSDKALSSPASLSGGQQYRVAIARALFGNPAFLLADEPTGNLDKKTGGQLIDYLQEYAAQHSTGLIISTHDESVAKSMKTVLYLLDGKMSTGISQIPETKTFFQQNL